jgi:hypothetical protein
MDLGLLSPEPKECKGDEVQEIPGWTFFWNTGSPDLLLHPTQSAQSARRYGHVSLHAAVGLRTANTDALQPILRMRFLNGR